MNEVDEYLKRIGKSLNELSIAELYRLHSRLSQHYGLLWNAIRETENELSKEQWGQQMEELQPQMASVMEAIHGKEIEQESKS